MKSCVARVVLDATRCYQLPDTLDRSDPSTRVTSVARFLMAPAPSAERRWRPALPDAAGRIVVMRARNRYSSVGGRRALLLASGACAYWSGASASFGRDSVWRLWRGDGWRLGPTDFFFCLAGLMPSSSLVQCQVALAPGAPSQARASGWAGGSPRRDEGQPGFAGQRLPHSLRSAHPSARDTPRGRIDVAAELTDRRSDRLG
jgi:hypothetical protein